MSSYYKVNDVEAIDVIDLLRPSFDLGSAIKYIWRAGLKPGADAKDDAVKALYYIDKIDFEERNSLRVRKCPLFADANMLVCKAFYLYDNVKESILSDLLLATFGLGDDLTKLAVMQLITAQYIADKSEC